MKRISDEDREIQQAAKDAHDLRTGKKRKGIAAKSFSGNTAFVNPKLRDRYIKVGRVLYYKDLNTGKICQGEVTKVTGKSFVFRFGNRTRTLPIGIVDHRLFYTVGEAKKYGMISKTKR